MTQNKKLIHSNHTQTCTENAPPTPPSALRELSRIVSKQRHGNWHNLYANYVLVLLFVSLLAGGCATKSYFSNVNQGFAGFPPSKISIDDAIRIAQPYLNQSYKLRLSLRKWPLQPSSPPLIYVTLMDQYYYVVKEDYPYQYREAYLEFAVKVNRNTGKVELITTPSDSDF